MSTRLPDGYVLPGITRADGSKMIPLCCHSDYAPGVGWWGDCSEPATLGRPSNDAWRDFDKYACHEHADILDCEPSDEDE